jgi:flagellar assembly factor FliW
MPSFETMRFGVLDYDDADVISIPDGLIGLPTLQRWLLLDMAPDVPMRWLQSLDRPDFGVPVMPPVFFAEEFEVAACNSVQRQFAGADEPELVSMVIATVHPGGEKVTGNLRAPLVMDIASRTGVQLALDDDRLSTRQEIDYFKFGLAVAGQAQENESQETEATAEPREAVEAAESVGSGL